MHVHAKKFAMEVTAVEVPCFKIGAQCVHVHVATRKNVDRYKPALSG